ncbi:MAG TPA: ABC transporter permease [Micromonospora sp.]
MTRALGRLLVVETRLFLRDRTAVLLTLALPTLVLCALGTVPALRRPEELLGDRSLVAHLAPSLLAMSVATTGLTTLPNTLVGYREAGVPRRLATTPVPAAALLAAQLLVNLAVLASSALLLITVGRLAFGVPLPGNLPWFAVALVLGSSATYALGLLVAAVARSVRMSHALTIPALLLTVLLGSGHVPRFLLPDALVRIVDHTPPGVRALLDSWSGAVPQPGQLVVMVAVTVGAGTVAAGLFRWK